MPKVYIHTHGCQMNDYDSTRMRDLLAQSHHCMDETYDPYQADLLLLNTCSIREKAQEKVFDQLGRWRVLKKQKPSMMIGVGGCVASQEGEAIYQRANFVDIIFGPQTLHRLPQMIDRVYHNRQKLSFSPVIDTSFNELEKFDLLPPSQEDGPNAQISIMEGCSQYCSFCIVPYTRGEELSRPPEKIVEEVEQLCQRGVREITLLGQNVNAYMATDRHKHTIDFADLLYILCEVNGIQRIRYTTSHPAQFSSALIDAHRELPKLAEHIHLPVQSGSDAILTRMKRGYCVQDYKNIVQQLYSALPNISLSSDFIIGFPGETEQDFAQTMDLVKEIKFDFSFSFLYSPRPGTPAAEMSDETPHKIKKERLQLLQNTLQEQAQNISRRMVGSIQSVLVTGRSARNAQQWTGRTSNNRVVHFASSRNCRGRFASIRITQSMPHSLRGECIAMDIPPPTHHRQQVICASS